MVRGAQAEPAIVPRLRVEDARAAALFVDHGQLRFLKPFVAGPCAVAPAARSLGVSISRMSYQVAKLRRLGLVCPCDDGARSGRRYVAVARQFVVPLRVVPADDLEALYARFQEAWQRERRVSVVVEALRRARDWEIRYPDAPGSGRIAFVPAGAASAADLGVVDQTWTLALQPADARRLQQELIALVARFAALPPGPGAEPHLVGITAVRRHPVRGGRLKAPR
jgi:hypothetical protein